MTQITSPQIDFENLTLWLLNSGLQILLILILAFIATRLLGIATRQIAQRVRRLDNIEGGEIDKRTTTIVNVVHKAGLAVIVITALLMILDKLTIDITPMLASVGVIGLALGLGAQTLVKDLIGGLFILIEGHYQVGDSVELQSKVGTVEDLSLRVTVVRDFQGNLHIIPNGEIRLITNRGRGWSRAIVDVNITHEEDIERAVAALEEIGREAAEAPELGRLFLETPTVLGVEALGEGQIMLRLVVKTLPTEQWGVQRQLRRRIQERFATQEIRLAVPRREILITERNSNADDTA